VHFLLLDNQEEFSNVLDGMLKFGEDPGILACRKEWAEKLARTLKATLLKKRQRLLQNAKIWISFIIYRSCQNMHKSESCCP
jgi:hypothetical protein